MPKPIIMMEKLARAAAHDAGNRSMKAAGRKKWNADDYNAACDELERLWPNPQLAEEEST